MLKRTRALDKITEKTSQEIIEDCTNEIQKKWKDIYNTILNNYNFGKANYKPKPISQEYDAQASANIVNKFQNYRWNTNATNIFSKLGNEYEEYFQSQLNQFFQTNYNYLTAELTAKISSIGTRARAKGKYGPTDIFMGPLSSFKNKTEIMGFDQYGQTVTYDIEVNVDENTEHAIFSNPNLISSIIASNPSFGFQLKNIAGGGNYYSHSYANSAIIRDEFIGITNKTWHEFYAMAKLNNMISARLIDIIGPSNVALITQNQIRWMDEYIENTMFFMNLYYNHRAARGSDKELVGVNPSNSGSIHTRVMKDQWKYVAESFVTKDNEIVYKIKMKETSN